MTPRDIGNAFYVVLSWLFVVALTALALYAIRRVWDWPIRRWVKEPNQEIVTRAVVVVAAVVLGLTWWLQPIEMIYDPNAPPD